MRETFVYSALQDASRADRTTEGNEIICLEESLEEGIRGAEIIESKAEGRSELRADRRQSQRERE
jgi:hypothetical protein